MPLYTANGSYTVPAGVRRVKILCLSGVNPTKGGSLAAENVVAVTPGQVLYPRFLPGGAAGAGGAARGAGQPAGGVFLVNSNTISECIIMSGGAGGNGLYGTSGYTSPQSCWGYKNTAVTFGPNWNALTDIIVQGGSQYASYDGRSARDDTGGAAGSSASGATPGGGLTAGKGGSAGGGGIGGGGGGAGYYGGGGGGAYAASTPYEGGAGGGGSAMIWTQLAPTSGFDYEPPRVQSGDNYIKFYRDDAVTSALFPGAAPVENYARVYIEPYEPPAPALVAGNSTSRSISATVRVTQVHPQTVPQVGFDPVPIPSWNYEVQISGNSDFSFETTKVGTVAGTVNSAVSVPFETSLQGTVYIRARLSSALVGDAPGPWATTQITVNHRPVVTLVSPSGGARIKHEEAGNLFTFRVSDSASTDRVTAYEWSMEDNATGVVFASSGGEVLPPTPLALATDIPVMAYIPPAKKNQAIRWRVRTRDLSGVWSNWSGYGVFYANDVPEVTILEPGVAVASPAPVVSWSASNPGAAASATVDVRITDKLSGSTAFSVSATGFAGSVTPTQAVLANGREYALSVTVTDAFGLAGTATREFAVAFVQPDPIEYNVSGALVEAQGFAGVEWSAAEADPNFISWNVYRRELPSTDWVPVATIPNELTRIYRDFFVRSAGRYMYSVTQTVVRFGEVMESPVGVYLKPSASAPDEYEQVFEDRIVDIQSTNYWLINERYPELSVRLPGVIEDASTEEYEQEVYAVVGRGRRVDHGTRLGYTGSLTLQIRQPEAASALRRAVEQIRAAQDEYTLRTPFGQLFKVSLGDLQWSALPGTGTAEMGDMTIPYMEVF